MGTGKTVSIQKPKKMLQKDCAIVNKHPVPWEVHVVIPQY